jgi:hypothetical protein
VPYDALCIVEWKVGRIWRKVGRGLFEGIALAFVYEKPHSASEPGIEPVLPNKKQER